MLRDDLDALTSSLAFLQQVGLTPIVVHGAGPQLDNELSAAGIEKHTVDGLRVTSPQALAIVRRVFQAQNLKLVEALQQSESRATSITSGVFEADYLDRDIYGLVGRITRVNLAPIEASLHAGSIPVIASMGETVGGQILNVNADFAANELVQVLQPYKISFLTESGRLLDELPRRDRLDNRPPNTTPDHAAVDQGGMRVKIADQGFGQLPRLRRCRSRSRQSCQGTVYAQGIRHARAARRESIACHELGSTRPRAHAQFDRVEFRAHLGR